MADVLRARKPICTSPFATASCRDDLGSPTAVSGSAVMFESGESVAAEGRIGMSLMAGEDPDVNEA
jgi:hypothetical protein